LIHPGEDRLISFSTLALEDDEKKRELKKILEEEVEWQEFFGRETLLLIFHNFKKLSLESSIPPPIRKSLERYLLSNAGYNIISLENLARLLKILNENKIPVIVLKGAALCETVYPHIGTRSFCDLDIMVQPKDLQRVKRELERLDYSFFPTAAQHHLVACLSSNHSLPLEVHWDLVNETSPFQKYAFKLSMERFWEEAIPLKIRGADALSLSPEHQLIYLAVHMLKEGYKNRKWLVDIYFLLKSFKGKIKWDKLIEDCREFQVRRPVYYALTLVDRLFHLTEMNERLLGGKVLQELKPARISLVEKIILKQVLKSARPASNVKRLFLYLFSIERFSDRLKAFFALLKYSFLLPSLRFKERNL
jgi:hypothetical protein